MSNFFEYVNKFLYSEKKWPVKFSKNQLTFDDTYRVQQRFHGNKTFVVVAVVAAAVGAVDAKLRKI